MNEFKIGDIVIAKKNWAKWCGPGVVIDISTDENQSIGTIMTTIGQTASKGGNGVSVPCIDFYWMRYALEKYE